MTHTWLQLYMSCRERPAVCSAESAAGQEWGNTFLCAERGERTALRIEPLFPVCDVCHTCPSVNFIPSPEEGTLPASRNLDDKGNFLTLAKAPLFLSEVYPVGQDYLTPRTFFPRRQHPCPFGIRFLA